MSWITKSLNISQSIGPSHIAKTAIPSRDCRFQAQFAANSAGQDQRRAGWHTKSRSSRNSSCRTSTPAGSTNRKYSSSHKATTAGIPSGSASTTRPRGQCPGELFESGQRGKVDGLGRRCATVKQQRAATKNSLSAVEKLTAQFCADGLKW